jgi:hypothetical protein
LTHNQLLFCNSPITSTPLHFCPISPQVIRLEFKHEHLPSSLTLLSPVHSSPYFIYHSIYLLTLLIIHECSLQTLLVSFQIGSNLIACSIDHPLCNSNPLFYNSRLYFTSLPTWPTSTFVPTFFFVALPGRSIKPTIHDHCHWATCYNNCAPGMQISCLMMEGMHTPQKIGVQPAPHFFFGPAAVPHRF